MKSGTQQCHVVIDLKPETTYYFTIKAYDAAANPSSLSNCARGKTQQDRFSKIRSNYPSVRTFAMILDDVTDLAKWFATHHDYLRGVGVDSISRLKIYNQDLLIGQYITSAWVRNPDLDYFSSTPFQKWADEEGVDYESLFLHCSKDTYFNQPNLWWQGPFQGIVRGWDEANDLDKSGYIEDDELPFVNPKATARSKKESRVFSHMSKERELEKLPELYLGNFSSPYFCQFQIRDLLGKITASHNGFSYDGIGRDDCPVRRMLETSGEWPANAYDLEVIEYPEGEDGIERYKNDHDLFLLKFIGSMADKLYLYPNKSDLQKKVKED